MESERRTKIRKNSQDWEWQPKEKGQLPRGRRESQDNIVSSGNVASGTDGSMTEAYIEPGWRINDILLAARVLQNTRPSPSYANEAEMRRVFGLVYDVLRCEISSFFFLNIHTNVDAKRFLQSFFEKKFLSIRKVFSINLTCIFVRKKRTDVSIKEDRND